MDTEAEGEGQSENPRTEDSGSSSGQPKTSDKGITENGKKQSGDNEPQGRQTHGAHKNHQKDESDKRKNASDKEENTDNASEKKIGRRKVTASELDDIIDRLYSTSTMTSSAKPFKAEPFKVTDTISRSGTSSADVQEITNRLSSAQTKSSSGGVGCKAIQELNPVGYGLKAYPIIEGIETRFKGSSSSGPKDDGTRLMSAQTRASKSRMDNPAILLYPERTMLMNNPERIRAYQVSKDTVRQNVLGRREKWYN